MLKSLHIENYALIQMTDVAFESDFVVITGETGAGKSIILGALGLLLGQRADLQALGDKEKKCVVEALFDISREDTVLGVIILGVVPFLFVIWYRQNDAPFRFKLP